LLSFDHIILATPVKNNFGEAGNVILSDLPNPNIF
jgi:hypothetical protein